MGLITCPEESWVLASVVFLSVMGLPRKRRDPGPQWVACNDLGGGLKVNFPVTGPVWPRGWVEV